jgi:hypothetical protein
LQKLLPFSHFDFYSISKLWSQREIFRLYEERIYPFVLYIADRWTGIDLGGMVIGGLSATDLGDFSIIGGYVRSLTWLIRHQQFACQIFRNLSTKFFLCTARRLQDSCCSIPDTVDRVRTGDATLRLNEYIDLLSQLTLFWFAGPSRR